MDRLRSMSVFTRAVELGSFAAAAHDLGMSPAMTAKHVRYLENRLGTVLIQRTTRRNSLTEIGRVYYERCTQLLADAEASDQVASDLQSTPRGVLRVTAPVVVGAQWVARTMGDFQQFFPEVEIDLVLTDRVVDLVDEGFDVALRSGTITHPGLVARPLKPITMLLAASPVYLKRHGTPRKPMDLADHFCLDFSHWAHRERWRLIGPRGEERFRVKSRIHVNSGEALRQAALGGAGIAMQSEMLLRSDIERGDLVRILPQFAPPSRAIHIVYLRTMRTTPKLKCFVEFMIQRFSNAAVGLQRRYRQ